MENFTPSLSASDGRPPPSLRHATCFLYVYKTRVTLTISWTRRHEEQRRQNPEHHGSGGETHTLRESAQSVQSKTFKTIKWGKKITLLKIKKKMSDLWLAVIVTKYASITFLLFSVFKSIISESKKKSVSPRQSGAFNPGLWGLNRNNARKKLEQEPKRQDSNNFWDFYIKLDRYVNVGGTNHHMSDHMNLRWDPITSVRLLPAAGVWEETHGERNVSISHSIGRR